VTLGKFQPATCAFLGSNCSDLSLQSVGKTSLMNRYSTGKFTGQYKATIGADFLSKECIVTDYFGQRNLVSLQIWDTAGQERFQSLGNSFYRGSDCAMLVYDITDPASLDNLSHWKQEFLEQTNGLGGAGLGAPFPFVVLGNKVDKEKDRKVPRQRVEEWCSQAASTGLTHFETSAKTASNVEEAFHEVSRLALQYEDYKRRSQPQLFVPPAADPIDLRRSDTSMSDRDTCC
jgi:Ras-related protein Rab-7A